MEPKDRYRYRIGLTVYAGVDYETGDDIHEQIIIDTFSIDTGGCGFVIHESILEEALCHLDKEAQKIALDFIRCNFCETDDYYFIDSVDFLEQCTGLTDRNGKLVYEGDIIYSPRDGGTTKIIYFDEGLASFRAYNKDTDIRSSHQIGDGYLIELGFEVIGNIHENPYLIKD